MVAASSESLNLDVLARVGLALADDSRRRLLVRLTDGAAYPSELAEALSLSRANVSNHLACLRGCGLVVAEPEGRRVRYELSDPHLGHALRELLSLVLATDASICPVSNEGCC
jgi:DNA-binding transcriptional ArsR family regulator